MGRQDHVVRNRASETKTSALPRLDQERSIARHARRWPDSKFGHASMSTTVPRGALISMGFGAHRRRLHQTDHPVTAAFPACVTMSARLP
jgi:hypothetical protein